MPFLLQVLSFYINFEIPFFSNFPFLDGDAPRCPAYGVYISQLIIFARVCSHVEDFNACNKTSQTGLIQPWLSVS